MKRFLSILFVFVLLLTVTSTAFAAQKGPKPVNFAVVGTIAAIDPVAKTVTIQVITGNKAVKAYIGQTITLSTTLATKYRFTDGVTTTLITFSNLVVGNPVSATGSLTNYVWGTKGITVGAQLSCIQ